MHFAFVFPLSALFGDQTDDLGIEREDKTARSGC